MKAYIPFSGFYCSLHDDEIDGALAQMFGDDQGEANAGLVERFYRRADFSKVHQAYAKAYGEAFSEKFDLHAKFVLMDSPREFNFTTDQIMLDLPVEQVERVFDETPADALTKMADEMFKTRDGFISFYDHQWRNWGPPEDWDQNQIWCLLRAYVGKDFDQYAELDLMERARCNGHLDTWLYDCNPEAGRLCKIHDYLRRRAARLETA